MLIFHTWTIWPFVQLWLYFLIAFCITVCKPFFLLQHLRICFNGFLSFKVSLITVLRWSQTATAVCIYSMISGVLHLFSNRDVHDGFSARCYTNSNWRNFYLSRNAYSWSREHLCKTENVGSPLPAVNGGRVVLTLKFQQKLYQSKKGISVLMKMESCSYALRKALFFCPPVYVTSKILLSNSWAFLLHIISYLSFLIIFRTWLGHKNLIAVPFKHIIRTPDFSLKSFHWVRLRFL